MDLYIESAASFFKDGGGNHSVIDRVESGLSGKIAFRSETVLWAKAMRLAGEPTVWTAHKRLAHQILMAVGRLAPEAA